MYNFYEDLNGGFLKYGSVRAIYTYDTIEKNNIIFLTDYEVIDILSKTYWNYK